MTLSTAQLDALFTNANEGFAPDAATQLLLAAYAQQTIGGGLTDSQALLQALHIPPPADGSVGSNTPESTTDVALAVYQFFTGSAPSLAGLDYLVNGGGNPNDLDSAYYAGFNQANRYYNFAINLITGNAAVAASFQAAYGSATFDQVVTAAYESIVGTPNVGATQAAAAVAAIEAQQSYFAQIAAERAPNVNQDLATKAIAIAYILEEAIKADVGYYAYAIDQFDIALAQGGDNVPGETSSGVDLLTQFPIIPPGQTFTLTPGVDTINPPASNNNTVNGTELTFTPFDTINLGATTGNVFNWVDSTQGGGWDVVVPTDAQVSGVQTFNVSSAGHGLFVDTTSFVGLQTLNADIFSYDGSVLTAGPATNVNLVYTATGDSDPVSINGGAVITAQMDNPNGYYQAFLYVNGGPGTNAVDITWTGTGSSSGSTEINDGYATITNISLTGGYYAYADIDAGSSLVGGIALSNLTIDDSSYFCVSIQSGNGSPDTLNVNLNNDYALSVYDEGGNYSTLNVNVGPKGAYWTPSFSGVTVENAALSGDLTQDSENMTALESLIISGTGDYTDSTLAGLAESDGNLTLVDASASSGAITVSLDGGLTAFVGGAGVDTVTVDEDVTVSIAGGSSGANEIILNVAAAALTAATYADVTGFQILGTEGDSAGTYNLGGFAVPIANVEVIDNPAGALTFTGAAVDQTLSIDASLTSSVTLIQGATAAAGSHNVLNLNIGTASTDGIDTSNIGTGFTNPVGTDVSVAQHAGATATVSSFTAGAPTTFWHISLTTPTIIAGPADLQWNDPAHSITVDVKFTSSVVSTDLTYFAAQINAGDPNVTATVSGDVITVTSDIGGTAGNLPGSNFTSTTVGDFPGATGNTAVAGTNATPGSGTIQVTAVDGVPNQLSVGDSNGFIGNIELTGGESKLTVANDIAVLLSGDSFTGVSVNVVTDTVSFTYPNVGENSLGTTDTVAQVDTISLTGVTVAAGDIFQEIVNGVEFSYTAGGGDTATDVATALAAQVNAYEAAHPGVFTVVATTSGANVYLTEASGFATSSFTSTQVNETTFSVSFTPYGPAGSNAITANNYQTVNLDSRGKELGGHNTVYLADNALTTLNVSGAEDLNLFTSGGHLLANIDTTGASGTLGLNGVLASEVTTGITANLGDASVYLTGNAATGFTDVVSGGNGTDHFYGNAVVELSTGVGGNSDVSFGNGAGDFIRVDNGTANSLSEGNGNNDTVFDFSNGADTISVGNGHNDFVELTGHGNSLVTVGNGAADTVDDYGSGNNTIHVGSGAGDTVVLGSGTDTVTFGSGSGDKAVFHDGGIGHVTFTGALATADFSSVDDASFAIATTTSQPSILAGSLDTVTGLVHGDQIILPNIGDALAPALETNLAGVTGEVVFAPGTLSGGVFSYSATGHDALMTYDNAAGNFVQVVLVGGAAEASHAVLSGHTITF